MKHLIKEVVQRTSTINMVLRTAESLLERLLRRTEKVLMNAEPALWHKHHYGLTTQRWGHFIGKSYWITGAGSGYGRALACALAAAGARVFLTGRRIASLQETITGISALNIPVEGCHVIEADITDPEQVQKAGDRIKSLCPALDGLVNNAAINYYDSSSAPLQKSSLEAWNQMIKTNVTAHWLITRSIWPHLLASGQVRVLFISSGAGWEDSPGFGIYNVTKAALNSLTHSLAAEYSHSFPGEDIQINALVPGYARTEMNPSSTRSPYEIVSMALILLSHPEGGPNGRFFHQDGRHLAFGITEPYGKPLM